MDANHRINQVQSAAYSHSNSWQTQGKKIHYKLKGPDVCHVVDNIIR